jgi:hypothetical protein
MSLWADSRQAGSPFARTGTDAARVDAVERVKEWTAQRFGLGERDTIVVSERSRETPGFPPRETVVAFWSADGTRHHFNVFRRIEEVAESDIPPSWLRASLANNGFDCDCC